MGNNCPLQEAHPFGAKLNVTHMICPTNGSTALARLVGQVMNSSVMDAMKYCSSFFMGVFT